MDKKIQPNAQIARKVPILIPILKHDTNTGMKDFFLRDDQFQNFAERHFSARHQSVFTGKVELSRANGVNSWEQSMQWKPRYKNSIEAVDLLWKWLPTRTLSFSDEPPLFGGIWYYLLEVFSWTKMEEFKANGIDLRWGIPQVEKALSIPMAP